MSTVFLASHLQNYYKNDNGIKVPCELSDKNQLVTNLKRSCKNLRNLLFVASDPNDYEKNQQKLQILIDSMKLSGIEFDSYNILDARNIEQTAQLTERADLVYLTGGHTYEQKQFFDKIKLKEAMVQYSGVVVGVSAGAINLAKDVFNSPEKFAYYAEPIHYEGLGLVDINVRAHFQNDISQMDQETQARRRIDLTNSYNRTIYGIEDGSYILFENGQYTLFGQGCIMKNGQIETLGSIGQNSILKVKNIDDLTRESIESFEK